MDKFDLIIANPPFRVANKVISTFMDKADESIVLAPAKCYRDRNVYKYIDELQLADPKLFKDAAITGNLSIVRLINKENNQSYKDLYIDNICVPEFKEYYKKNINTKARWKELLNLSTKNINDYDVTTTFIIPSRASNTGVCKSRNTADFHYNVLNDKKYMLSYIIQLPEEKAKKNLSRFYYYNPLMNSLLHGLNNTGGTNLCRLAAIPHIDWSIDRDYENCNLDDIMKWLDDDDQSWEEIELLTYNEKYRKYYEKNLNTYHYTISETATGTNPFYDSVIDETIPEKNAFVITTRCVGDGVHKIDNETSRGFDVQWNIDHSVKYSDIKKKTYENRKIDKAIIGFNVIYFKSTTEVNNLTTFWYKNPLMNELIKGLNKTSGSCSIAIPHIDWSKDRDYEHCTLDDIMMWLDDDDQSWEEIELLTYDPKYKAFYELNSRCSNYAIDAYERVPQRDGIRWDYDVNKAFAIMARTAQNGVHKVDGKGAFDLDVNIYKTKTIADTPIWKHSDGRDAQAAASYIYFNSTTEKDNLVKFWYYNPLMNSLLKGLNKAGGNFKIAIPNIDWSKERDYEHCTLDDIMKWLEEDNQ